MRVWDVIISGAGIIGVSLALKLREQGADVLVLDSGEPGKEASSAAAGMLSGTDPETPPALQPLTRASAQLYPKFVERIESTSGMKVDFRQGAIILLRSGDTPPKDAQRLSSAELTFRESALRTYDCVPYSREFEHSVDPALLMRAALRAARSAGAEIRGNTPVRRMNSSAAQIEVMTGNERFVAQAAINCQGAWAGVPVRPRKGQMMYLEPKNPALLKNVVRTPEVYLVPRSSGKVLAGATVEDVGFDKTVDPQAIRQLHEAAAKFVPELASAKTDSSWAGLRPGTPDDLPIMGRTEAHGIFVATGHFRNGILLAPITAEIIAALIAGAAPPVDISAFSPARFANVTTAVR